MKKLFILLFAVVAMATTTVSAQENISFVNEIGCEVSYDVDTLADIILSGYEPVDEEESAILMAEFDEVFPSSGPDELAWTVLVPDDEYFYTVYIQETKRGKILKMFIHAEDGWLEATPGQSRALRRLSRRIGDMWCVC